MVRKLGSAAARALLPVMVLGVAAAAAGQTLSCSDAEGAAGGTAAVEFRYTAGAEAVTAVQFEVGFDSTHLAAVGGTASVGSHQYRGNLGLLAGALRALLYHDQNAPLADGARVTLEFAIDPAARDGDRYQLALAPSGVVFSKADETLPAATAATGCWITVGGGCSVCGDVDAVSDVIGPVNGHDVLLLIAAWRGGDPGCDGPPLGGDLVNYCACSDLDLDGARADDPNTGAADVQLALDCVTGVKDCAGGCPAR